MCGSIPGEIIFNQNLARMAVLAKLNAELEAQQAEEARRRKRETPVETDEEIALRLYGSKLRFVMQHGECPIIAFITPK